MFEKSSRLYRFAVLALVTCASVLFASSSTATQTSPPEFRLPGDAAPTYYLLDLFLTPDQDTFQGTVEIAMEFKKPISILWLNAQGLTVKEAVLTAGSEKITPKVLPQPKNFVGFDFGHAIPAGPATIRITYTGPISRQHMEGIFQRKDHDRWYVYSQFENDYGRQAIPCFDEPGYKVPWQLTLHVPREFGAYSNTPVASEVNDPGATKTVKFAETKPLPAYLVAVAVGPFEILNARDTGAKRTKVRIIYPQGHGHEADFAAKATPEIVELLEKYFGIPYPYEKLDEVAIPMANYAMEHPGMVTYGSAFFLFPPDATDLSIQREGTSVIAHELAHQWFGDLVTMAWWDDAWLNEAFASWMADKITDEYKPDWHAHIDQLNSTQKAMGVDALLSSRSIRQPVETESDIDDAFDSITYDKGSGVLSMFESFVGKEPFRQRVHNYLEKYSWRNAKAADFLAEIAAGDEEIAHAFTTFLDQPGVPLVAMTQQCAGGNSVSLQLSQQRFLPRGTKPTEGQLWSIPVCVRYASAGGEQRECTLLKAKTAKFALTKSTGCPAWFYGNADEGGYYRVGYTEPALNAMVKQQDVLSLTEKVGFLGNLAALTRATLPKGQSLGMVPAFAHDRQRAVVVKTLDLTTGLEDYLVPERLLPAYHRYLSDLYKQRAQQLGPTGRPGESPDERLLRPELFEAMATHAEDETFIAQAKELANQWLTGKQKPDPDMFGNVLNSAAEHGDRAFFELLSGAAKKEANELLRYSEMIAMGQFRDPAVEREALALILDTHFDWRDSRAILRYAMERPYSRDQAWQFMKSNWDAIAKRVPADVAQYLPNYTQHFCDAQHLADVESFFRPKIQQYQGGIRSFDQDLEAIRVCIANRQANQSSVEEFLGKY